MIFANRYRQIEAALTHVIGLRKTKADRNYLTTAQGEINDSDARATYLLGIVSDGRPLEECEARDVVWFVDFLAVAAPDNCVNSWNAEMLTLASALRREFAKTFGTGAYDV